MVWWSLWWQRWWWRRGGGGGGGCGGGGGGVGGCGVVVVVVAVVVVATAVVVAWRLGGGGGSGGGGGGDVVLVAWWWLWWQRWWWSGGGGGVGGCMGRRVLTLLIEGKEEMVKAMLLKVGIALVLMLLALSFTAEARRSEARWLSVRFEKLPKGALVPPSVPLGRTNFVPPQAPLPLDSLANSRMMFQHLPEARWSSVHFGKLPKGAPVPPSAPSGGINFVPPQAPLPPNSLANSRMVFQHLYLAHLVQSIPTPPLTQL
ncbi:hypothetical protein RHGRI_011633 [Rhododendron griersonianum]|uniref:Uncharacterized protein n=1 Tax=Rhododendron griersonianum TaxID=479676 RepID=A0AAV6KMQ3_9ERIC|nr:hypothetical protein RHGRI_011633 [Rhododendron griersonianum]